MPPTEPAVAAPPTLDALELPSLLSLLAELAATDAGRAAVAALRPTARLGELEGRRARFTEVRRLLSDGRLVPSVEVPLAAALDALRPSESGPEGGELLAVATLLRAVSDALQRIAAAEPECPALAELAAGQADPRPLLGRFEATLDRRGRVRDDASPRLGRLSAEVRRRRDRLYGELEAFASRHRAEIGEETVPVVGGRLVLLLRSGAEGRVGGLVHGRSASGHSVYFEPLEAVDGNNRFLAAQESVDQEKQRLLAELVAETRAALPALRSHLELLAELDLQQAAARFASLCGGRLADLSAGHDLELVEARHPLLDPALADLRQRALGEPGHREPVVPLSLAFESARRVLVVTGPNAGGKTVALKTLGLLTLATQAGLPVPAAAGTRLPMLGRVVATVGDEQSLLRDRSTFSARLLRLGEAWAAAAPDALVLLDELGGGTDPEEGAALAVALLEGLLERRCLAMLTTHLTPLAAAALERDGAACAAMEFDSATGLPSYRLLPGPPGGSEALALARRLGLPAAWLDRADELLGPEQRELRALLAEVEGTRRELAGERDRLRAERGELERLRGEAERLRVELESERRVLGKRLRGELQDFRRKVKEKLREAEEKLRRELAAGRRRGVVEEVVEELFEPAPRLAGAEPEPAGPVEEGALVEHRALGWRGVVERLERGRAEVKAAGKRLRAPAADLRRLPDPAPESPAAPLRSAGVTLVEAPPEVDAELHLIGRRIEPALEELDTYLDRALLTGREEVRVVHGHGSGRLRRAVRRHLKSHPAVASHRPGRQDEGGDGATVARLRE